MSRRYFKFENMWLKLNGFMDKIKQWLTTYSFQGSPSFIMAHKLKALKSDLKNGMRIYLATLRSKKNVVLDEICDLYIIAKRISLSNDEWLRKEEIIKDLERLILLKEVSWRQKSRAL